MTIQTGTETHVESPSILSKAFELLYAFNSRDRVMTLSEISRAADLPKSTVHRLLGRLVDLGAVEVHRSGYRLGIGLLQLGASMPSAAIRDMSLPYLAALQHWSKQTVHFGVLRNLDVVYLEKLAPYGAPISLTAIGSRVPANCTALGKTLLAFSDQGELASKLPAKLPRLTPQSHTDPDSLLVELANIRRNGIAHEVGEAQRGLACTGVPIIINGFAVAAVSISHAENEPLPPQAELALRDTAGRIVRDCKEFIAGGGESWFPQDA